MATIAYAVAANGTSATPKIGRHHRQLRIAVQGGDALWCGYLVPWRTFTRSAPASVWPTITCASDRWDNRRSAPGWAGQQQSTAGLTDPSAGGVAIPHRRPKVDVRAIARPIVLLAFAAIFRRAMASIRETSVMVDRLGDSAAALPVHDLAAIRAPQQSERDPSRARACWSSVVTWIMKNVGPPWNGLAERQQPAHPCRPSPTGTSPLMLRS